MIHLNGWQKKTVLFLASQTVSLTGSMVVSFAAIWYITLETSSGWMMTVATLCACLPQIVIAPVGGVWADRYSRKLLIIASDLFIAISTLALAILWLSGSNDFIFLFVVMAVRSLGGGIQTPAVGALLPQLVPIEKLTRVNAINATLMNVLTLLAPALGGVLLGSLGFAAALLFDVVTALLGVGVLSFLRVQKIDKALDAAAGSMLLELKEGIAYVRRTDWLRMLLILYSVGFFLIAPGAFLSPILVGRVFGSEVWMLTANEILWSVGAVVGGVVIAAWGGFKNRIFSIGFSLLFFGIFFALMGVISNFIVYLAVMAAAGFFVPLFSTANNTFIQEKTDEQMMGRVFSVISIIASSVMPLAMLIFGPLADLIDVRWIMSGSGVLMAIMALLIMPNKRLLAFDAAGRPDMKAKPYSEGENL